MAVLILLILASLALALFFLGGFIWAVRSGQFDDTCTPSLRVLTEEPAARAHRPASATNQKPNHHDCRNV